MTDSELKKVIMERDDLSSIEADQQIAEAKQRVAEGDDPEEVLLDDFGLEPDYLLDLI
jgi:hypothetical protein